MSESLLEFKNLTKIYRIGGGLGLISSRNLKAVDSVFFSMPLEKPMVTSLVGESGSGKSTIARIVLGLLEPTSGEVLYKGKRISEWVKKSKLEYLKQVQPIFQDPYSSYNPYYRVERTMEKTMKKFKLAKSKSEMKQKILETLKDVGLRPEDLLGRYPHQLSGGERQRFMLARILLVKPRLLIADEPVSMIDVSLRAIFLDQLMSLKEKYDTSCLYITHDLNTAAYIADNIVILCHGRIVEDGPKNAVMKKPMHPYSQLLWGSILIPDPKRRWKDRVDLSSLESFEKLRAGKGCVFSVRCPHVMEKCKHEDPQMVEVDPQRKVACFLYSK
jgi:peptide/nickel transport system ATP-binding protein